MSGRIDATPVPRVNRMTNMIKSYLPRCAAAWISAKITVSIREDTVAAMPQIIARKKMVMVLLALGSHSEFAREIGGRHEPRESR
jgi:hypothetical protein